MPRNYQKKIDWEKAKRCAEVFCHPEDIAHILGVCYHVLLRECKKTFGMTLMQWCNTHRAHGKMKILRKQYEIALKKNNVEMLKWLGKNYCGQSDRQYIEMDIQTSMLTDDEIKDKIIHLLSKYPEILGQTIEVEPVEGGNGDKPAIPQEQAQPDGQGELDRAAGDITEIRQEEEI